MSRSNSRQRKRMGLRIRGFRGNPAVAAALVRYARWLRSEYDFPIRVPVYLSPHPFVVTQDGHKCSASFFAPFDRDVEPYIRIATGDYVAIRKNHGRDNALAAYLCSLSHEVIHYQQWLETGDVWERGVAKRASRMVAEYACSVDHP